LVMPARGARIVLFSRVSDPICIAAMSVAGSALSVVFDGGLLELYLNFTYIRIIIALLSQHMTKAN
jgi:hypothetical protein